ncbi:hypothetical protein JXA84_08725 [candidate division WOR-3 bacterium]|nr:hypothetical protein [candidate division WOR-3 bacterium]
MRDGINIVLPHSLESRRVEFENYLDKACKRLSVFAERHGWERHVKIPFMKEVRIFDDKKIFNSQLLTLSGMETEIELPDTYCAALEKEILIAVTPEYYAEAYPEGVEEAGYEKLLTHEMAHRLHIRILNGDEDAMGPVWFFEGFAIFAAQQLKDDSMVLSKDDIKNIVENPQRGSYKYYSRVMEVFLKKCPLRELVFRAGEPGFNRWVKDNLISQL